MGLYRKDTNPPTMRKDVRPTWTKTEKREKVDQILNNMQKLQTRTLQKSANSPALAIKKTSLLLEAETNLRKYRALLIGGGA